MLFAHSIIRFPLVAVAALLLAACGQKGPLFMDTPPPAAELPATVTVDASKQAESGTEETGGEAKESSEAIPAETTLEVREQLQGEQPVE